ncbi:hypothetical protein [Paraburkholderia sp. JHI869]|uniref:hypothetical protein n=1 Tax=Paraburkholderia sp. JHI869 TaxID=3112959 RepID=UPI00317FD9E2
MRVRRLIVFGAVALTSNWSQTVMAGVSVGIDVGGPAPVYAAPVVVTRAPVVVAAPPVVAFYPAAPAVIDAVVIGWHGTRYWDGRRWWGRREWNARLR